MHASATPDIARELFQAMRQWPIYDPHSHIDPHRPAARHFDEILGYHYFTELAHSAGMPAGLVDTELHPDTRCKNLARWLPAIDNTVQYSWLVEIVREFHGFQGDAVDSSTIDQLIKSADKESAGTAWDEQVRKLSNIEAVFLTNDFDDPLTGWDTSVYIPCLRTDDLVLKLHEPRVRQRLAAFTGQEVGDLESLRTAIGKLFDHFMAHGVRACAISLPPDFVPEPPPMISAATPIRRVLNGMDVRPDEVALIRRTVFWIIAEFCNEHRLPFDLMIGPIRNIYPNGVAGGRDLFDRRVSLADYAPVFNAFPKVKFPVSTLSPDAGAELVAYSWIFPNVYPNGHWWYSNVPTFIAADLKARVEAVPKTKIIGYYSDAYKLEFVLPKFDTFRRTLAGVLAQSCMAERGWSIERCLGLAKDILVNNPKTIFARD
ncbi:amidohydrolase [bacterium]|nr:amidohydrolase [bacterium]